MLNKFQNARVMLSRIVEWYNEIKENTVPCEFEIIRKDVELIDSKLQIALHSATWSEYNQTYISDLHSDIKSLHVRSVLTKENITKIIKSLKSWGSLPMYFRHEGVKTALMMPEDFEAMMHRRHADCQRSKKLIDFIMDENFRLFFGLPLKTHVKKTTEQVVVKRQVVETIETLKSVDDDTDLSFERPSETSVKETDKAAQVSSSMVINRSLKSQSTGKSSIISNDSFDLEKTAEQLKLFRPYEQFIDSVIWNEIREALRISIKYIKVEMENRLEQSLPIFEAKLELQIPSIVYIPQMSTTTNPPSGLFEIMNTMLVRILSISEMLPLVAQPKTSLEDCRIETFSVFLETAGAREDHEVAEIKNMQTNIISLTRDTITDAIGFANSFERYNFLWLSDKKVCLENFLKYGQILTPEEVEKAEEGTLELPAKSPSLDDFKQVIDFYTELLEDISKYDIFHVFNSWLRVNMKGLKFSLINEISKWNYLFKKFLKDKVERDLRELDVFITQSTESLQQKATNEDSVTLLKILKTVGGINTRERQVNGMFGPLKSIVSLLKSYDLTFDDYVNNQFAELPERWITLKKLSAFVKQTIAPIQAYQVDLIKRRIYLFDLRTKFYHEKFIKSPFFRVPCANVYQLCDVVHEELKEMEKQIVSLRESAVHFQLNQPEEVKLMQCRKLIRMVKHIWDFLHAVSSCIDDWKMTPWKKINVEDMETECKRFSKEMRNFDKELKALKPFIETEAMIKNLLTSLRAITELQNPAIRERHWTELMVATKVSRRRLSDPQSPFRHQKPSPSLSHSFKTTHEKLTFVIGSGNFFPLLRS